MIGFALSLALALPCQVADALEEPKVLAFRGRSGPGLGKHIVFLAGDEEYRSEQGFPELARMLSRDYGFRCTVVFSLNKQGEIDPNTRDNQPGMKALDTADLCVMQLRFRSWPDQQMAHFVKYFESGKPICALRTSTHAFDYPAASTSAYRQFGWKSREWPGGFGKQVLGENWVSHWGNHGSQATMGIPEPKKEAHPVLRGITSVFGTTDVYEARPPQDAEVLMRGHVLSGMTPGSAPAEGDKKTAQGVLQDINLPLMPILWSCTYTHQTGKVNRVLTCTLATSDLQTESLFRLLINGCFWLCGLDKKISPNSKINISPGFEPGTFGFDRFKKGVKPADLGSGTLGWAR